jgi:hypothetical protein
VAALAHVDLSHVITSGMVTYPGLPVPLVADHLSRDAAEGIYGAITSSVDLVWVCFMLTIFVHLTALAMLARSRR